MVDPRAFAGRVYHRASGRSVMTRRYKGQWNGPDLVVCDLFKKNDTGFKQPRGSFYALPGKTTVADAAPSQYLLRIAAPDTRPISVEVRFGKAAQVGH